MVAWGDNLYGQTETPVGLANVVSIAGGGFMPWRWKAMGTRLLRCSL